jgi:hypothetical protein
MVDTDELNEWIDNEIDQQLQDPTLIPAEVAMKLAQKLRNEEHERLFAWIDTQIELVLHERIRGRLGSQRRREFSAATRQAEDGDHQRLELLLSTYRVNGDNLQKRLADLTREEVKFVAEDYHQRASQNANKAAFFDALHKAMRLGDRVSDLDEERIQKLYQQFVK